MERGREEEKCRQYCDHNVGNRFFKSIFSFPFYIFSLSSFTYFHTFFPFFLLLLKWIELNIISEEWNGFFFFFCYYANAVVIMQISKWKRSTWVKIERESKGDGDDDLKWMDGWMNGKVRGREREFFILKIQLF